MKILTCFQYIFPFLHDFYVQPFLAYSLEACGFCFVNLYLFANTQIKNAKLIFLIRSTLKFFHMFKSNSYWYEYLLRAITRIWYLQDLIIFPFLWISCIFCLWPPVLIFNYSLSLTTTFLHDGQWLSRA